MQHAVLPAEQVLEFLRNARSLPLIDCEWAVRYRRSGNVERVCFVGNDAAPTLCVDQLGRASLAPLRVRIDTILTVYNPAQYPFVLCSCCTPCCHECHLLELHGRGDLIAHSEYVGGADAQASTQREAFIERRGSGGRAWGRDKTHHEGARPYCCGLCAAIWPAGATTLRPRGERLAG